MTGQGFRPGFLFSSDLQPATVKVLNLQSTASPLNPDNVPLHRTAAYDGDNTVGAGSELNGRGGGVFHVMTRIGPTPGSAGTDFVSQEVE